MPDIVQKLIEDFSFLISIVVPRWLKNFFTLILGGQMGTGPFLNDTGGSGIALTIFAFTLIAFFNCNNVIKLLKKQAKDHRAQLIVITHDARLKKHFKNNLNLWISLS